MQPDLDWMDMFTLWESDYTDAGIWMICQCGDTVEPGVRQAIDKPTLGDMYLAAAEHIKEEHWPAEFARIQENVAVAMKITEEISQPNQMFTVENIRKAVEKLRNSNAGS